MYTKSCPRRQWGFGVVRFEEEREVDFALLKLVGVDHVDIRGTEAEAASALEAQGVENECALGGLV